MKKTIILLVALVALASPAAAQPGSGLVKTAPLAGSGSTASPLRITPCPDGFGYVHESGAWTCSPVGDITSVGATPGGGLTGGATSGPALLGLLTTCGNDQVLAWNGSAWACADRDSTAITYIAGDGLVLTGSTFDVVCGLGLLCLPNSVTIDPTTTQRRVTGACPAGSAIRTIAEDGSVTCEVDDGTTGTGTINRVAKWTGPGTLGDSIVTDNGSGVTIGTSTAQTHSILGRLLATSTGAQALGITHTPVDQTTSTGVVSISEDGTYDTTAGEVEITGLNLTFGPTRSSGANLLRGRGVRIHAFGAQRNIALQTQGGTNYLNTAAGESTGIGYAAYATLPAKLSVDGTFDATGAITEAGDRVISLAGTGLLKSGRTLSVDDTYVQRRVTGACPAGSSIRAIASDGTVTCETDDGTTGTGTTNRVAKWTGTGTLGDSSITDTGTAVGFTTPTHYTGSTPTLSACGTSPVISGNSSRGRVFPGTGATSCAVAFADAYPAGTEVVCMLTYQDRAGKISALTANDPAPTGFTIAAVEGEVLTGIKIMYACDGFTAK